MTAHTLSSPPQTMPVFGKVFFYAIVLIGMISTFPSHYIVTSACLSAAASWTFGLKSLEYAKNNPILRTKIIARVSLTGALMFVLVSLMFFISAGMNKDLKSLEHSGQIMKARKLS